MIEKERNNEGTEQASAIWTGLKCEGRHVAKLTCDVSVDFCNCCEISCKTRSESGGVHNMRAGGMSDTQVLQGVSRVLLQARGAPHEPRSGANRRDKLKH